MQLSDVLKLPEKTWTQKGNGVNAVINTVHKANQGNYGWQQPVNITDLTGNTMDITFETEYPESLLSQDHVGKRAIWRLKWWKGRRGQSISGYPEQQLDEAGQPEKWQLPSALQTPPQPQQGVQQPAQATKTPQAQNNTPDWDAIAEGKVRTQFIKAGIISKQLKCETLQDILSWTTFAMTGVDPDTVPNPHLDIQNKIHCCTSCGKPHPECSCDVPF